MNLADAIRRAAQSSGHSDPFVEGSFQARYGHEVPHTPDFSGAVSKKAVEEDLRRIVQEAERTKDAEPDTEEDVEVMFLRNGATLSPAEAPTPPSVPTNAVRLELFLAPEQVGSLMRSVFATQHSVMTLREAAQFLRIPGANLEQLASEKLVPAFQVDGKWRFSKVAIDEWMNDQGRHRDASSSP